MDHLKKVLETFKSKRLNLHCREFASVTLICFHALPQRILRIGGNSRETNIFSNISKSPARRNTQFWDTPPSVWRRFCTRLGPQCKTLRAKRTAEYFRPRAARRPPLAVGAGTGGGGGPARALRRDGGDRHLPASRSADIRWNSGSCSHFHIRLKVSRPDLSFDHGLGLRNKSERVPCDRHRTRCAKMA